jgi:hypothetical protein
MERARTLFDEDALNDAGVLWREADAMAKTFEANDPRRAASRHALGALAAAAGDRKRAYTLYGEALDAWQNGLVWVATMDTQQAARSSMFHLRLESKHKGAYPEITRARHTKTCAAGRAASEAALAVLDRDNERLAGAMAARRAAFGRRESGAAAMAHTLGETIEERIMDRWAERPAKRFDDERRLYAAALLAPLNLLPQDAP